jgi:signal transduction histidine kinase
MISLIKSRLANKMLVILVATVVVIMGTEIAVRIYFGTEDRIELINTSARELATSTYAGMKRPMAIGDAEAIKAQLSDIEETAKDVEVFICNFDQDIIYSTQEETLKTKMSDTIHNESALHHLTEMLKTGVVPESQFEDEVSALRYFVYLYPILNQKDCHHCHGASRNVLGSMVVRMSADRAYDTVTAQRNRTILLTFVGILILVTIIYIIVNRFVRNPLEHLADAARRFAEGDTDVTVDIKTDDEIGVFSNAFRYMVERVTSSNNDLEKEIQRKNLLLKERTKLIKLLERANRKLRELDTLKSNFLANMSHELRTPMNAIIGYTDLLIDRLDGPLNDEQEKSLMKIASNSKHLLQLINDILDISKIESGKGDLKIDVLDPQKLIASVIPTFEPRLKEKGLTFSVHIEKKLPSLYGDEDMIRQVLVNLLSNAVRFTQVGGITVSCQPSDRGISPGMEPIFAEICVEDTGVGIKEEDLGAVFDKFVQVDLTTVRVHEGTGLGLSIARALVALHKGMIWVTSEYGKGSRFCFTVPLSKAILEKPADPIIEPRMAEALANYYGKPLETFLKKPKYAGKPIRCWHYVRCGQPSCPAYGSKENRCWLILGTHCVGMKIASYPEKVDFCKGCELIEKIILERGSSSNEENERVDGEDDGTKQ